MPFPGWPRSFRRRRGASSNSRRRQKSAHDTFFVRAQLYRGRNAEAVEVQEGSSLEGSCPLSLLFNDSHQYPCPIADVYLQELQIQIAAENQPKPAPGADLIIVEPEQDIMADVAARSNPLENREAGLPVEEIVEKRTGDSASTSQVDSPDVPIRFSEKKRLNWSGKTCQLDRVYSICQAFLRFCISRPCTAYHSW